MEQLDTGSNTGVLDYYVLHHGVLIKLVTLPVSNPIQPWNTVISMKTKHSRHYGKAEESTRLMTSIRNDYVRYMRDLAKSGDREAIIKVVNGIHVRFDFEIMMECEDCESIGVEPSDLLMTPEAFAIEYGSDCGLAFVKALNLKHSRQALRSILREHRMTEAEKIINGWADEVEAFLGE